MEALAAGKSRRCCDLCCYLLQPDTLLHAEATRDLGQATTPEVGFAALHVLLHWD